MLHGFLTYLRLFVAFCSITLCCSAKTGLHPNSQTTNNSSGRSTPVSRIITPIVPQEIPYRDINTIKEWNIFIYIAGNNNLHRYLEANIQQTMSIGSNDKINIIIQVDKFGTREVTRSLVQKGALATYWRASSITQAERNAHPELYNSGSVQNFTDFLQTGMQKFKAKKQCVIIWNHGSGAVDPSGWRNPTTGSIIPNSRGVAFNDSYGYYLSNQDLTQAFSTISRTCLNGNPIDILGLDVCCCGQIEIAAQVKGLVSYVVASQEVEIAYGWNYSRAFGKVAKELRTPLEFSTDIVNAYREEYMSMLPDYTLAIYDLAAKPQGGKTTYFELLEEGLSDIADKLITLLKGPQTNLVRQVITDARKKKNQFCDFYFNEYIDLHLFLISIQNGLRQALNLNNFRNNYPETTKKMQDVVARCVQTLEILYKVVPCYTAGPAFSGNPMRSRGISISFPLRVIHPSLHKTAFAQKTRWVALLKEYLNLR